MMDARDIETAGVAHVKTALPFSFPLLHFLCVDRSHPEKKKKKFPKENSERSAMIYRRPGSPSRNFIRKYKFQRRFCCSSEAAALNQLRRPKKSAPTSNPKRSATVKEKHCVIVAEFTGHGKIYTPVTSLNNNKKSNLKRTTRRRVVNGVMAQKKVRRRNFYGYFNEISRGKCSAQKP